MQQFLLVATVKLAAKEFDGVDGLLLLVHGDLLFRDQQTG
jgi:hypothetical protein